MNDIIQDVESATGGGVIIWHVKHRGFLACLCNDNLDHVPSTTIWDYQPTAEKALEALFSERRAMLEKALSRRLAK